MAHADRPSPKSNVASSLNCPTTEYQRRLAMGRGKDFDVLPIDTPNPGPEHFRGGLLASEMGRQTLGAVTTMVQFSHREDASEKAPSTHD
jgi:hypothetical protein